MLKLHDLETVVFPGGTVYYFSIREKNDYCGNPRFRVYILFNGCVYETIFKCYNSQIPERVKTFLERRDVKC